MRNTLLVHLNNAAIDYLNVGNINEAQNVLCRAFNASIRHSHQRHNLEASKQDMSLEYVLQDCFQPLHRRVRGCENTVSSELYRFLSLNFIRIETSHLTEESVDLFCSCALSWAIGYNLSVVYSLVGLLRGIKTGGESFLKRASRILMPIRRQILLQHSTSTFWLSVKLCVLNNSICILREIGSSDLSLVLRTMEELLDKSRPHLRPLDVKNFYLSIQFMNVGNSYAAAA